ncbi:MAG TPA: mannose-1-phosphate guanylyltransferase/mannose-6-phosphate isomerase [Rhodobacteraceae bacterium]|nr:mannose-1-phosphate guanylyltransferase/mannose-6-phosphate isomerase [Paracoccaceae bacterium]
MKPLLPVILAGGSGTRLWPLSRKHYAKQYLQLDGAHTMLQNTLSRLDGLSHLPPMLICNEDSRFLAAEQARQLGVSASILLEPAGRNTAPALAMGALEAQAMADDPVLLVMPADHKIRDNAAFLEAVKAGSALAEEGDLVTFGIPPSHAETGYGYIHATTAKGAALKVEAFVEKPDEATATEYVASGDYYWNSGVFMFRASSYLAALRQHRPDILRACKAAYQGRMADLDFLRFDKDAFLACPAESIDYAVMEKAGNLAMLPLDAGWSDIGSWAALWAASAKTSAQNCEIGDVVSLEGRGNYINAQSRLVAAVGCEDMVIVETKDAVFVAPKAGVAHMEALVARLKADNRPEVAFHRDVYRPWGSYDKVDEGARYLVKRITVKPGGKLSVQKHFHRAEHWVVVRGTAWVTKGDEVLELSENQSIYLPLGVVHALENRGKTPLELIEVQTGDYLAEDDIERLEDRYGRT